MAKKRRICTLWIYVVMVGILGNCNGQTPGNTMKKIDRQPAVAGTFYPADADGLRSMLDSMFKGLKPETKEQPLAVIVPHAGYVFSAGVAAKAISQIDREASFDRIFIIGSSHTMHFDGSSVYTQGDFITPFGKVEVDALAEQLCEKHSFISSNPQPHAREHCLEVELPLLQYWLKKPFKIVPIVIGGYTEKTSKKLAEALEPYFNSNNLFVISTDFSHYPKYADAVMSDGIMAEAIVSNSSRKFLLEKEALESKGISNLATAVCGWTSVLTLLYITEKLEGITIKKIDYKNSGDSPYGGNDKVVGYNAICVYQENKQPSPLSDSDKKKLLTLARKTITDYANKIEIKDPDAKDFEGGASMLAGAFVTLHKNGKLRGCIGTFRADQPLYKTVQSIAISSAFADSRFEPVSAEEVPSLHIEISVLTPMRKINSIDEIVLGKHGIYIRKGSSSGVFLPQVATEQKWTKEQFLGYCARDKAYIGWDGWRDAEIYVFESIIFEEAK
ncbi:MAG TPA: AmmeMemoRadiSam system protein B [Bacteroidales bacterium]|nr:AmmeMemoRadiSam system protein B [Bacteroidales bacterium]